MQDQLRTGAAEGGTFPAVTLGHAPGHHEVAMAVPCGCPSPVGTLPAELLACSPSAMAWSLPVPPQLSPSALMALPGVMGPGCLALP